MPDTWDDEQLLAALKESLRARQAVPPEFVEAAKNAYAWHNIDAELAQLTYDSIRDQDAVPAACGPRPPRFAPSPSPRRI